MDILHVCIYNTYIYTYIHIYIHTCIYIYIYICISHSHASDTHQWLRLERFPIFFIFFFVAEAYGHCLVGTKINTAQDGIEIDSWSSPTFWVLLTRFLKKKVLNSTKLNQNDAVSGRNGCRQPLQDSKTQNVGEDMMMGMAGLLRGHEVQSYLVKQGRARSRVTV